MTSRASRSASVLPAPSRGGQRSDGKPDGDCQQHSSWVVDGREAQARSDRPRKEHHEQRTQEEPGHCRQHCEVSTHRHPLSPNRSRAVSSLPIMPSRSTAAADRLCRPSEWREGRRALRRQPSPPGRPVADLVELTEIQGSRQSKGVRLRCGQPNAGFHCQLSVRCCRVNMVAMSVISIGRSGPLDPADSGVPHETRANVCSWPQEPQLPPIHLWERGSGRPLWGSIVKR